MTRVRFAPSPTGFLHVGGLRTALFNYLYVKKTGGKLVLRIEDTDQNRKVEDAAVNIINIFHQLGVEFDEGPQKGGDFGPYVQSQRLDIYRKHVKQLLDDGNAYPCFCSTERLEDIRNNQAMLKEHIRYDRHCMNFPTDEAKIRIKKEPHVIRMRIPADEEIIFYDIVRDRISVHSDEMDDQVLMKSDGYPTYHLANVLDDHLMGITHVIRGEEWLPSTPKHILLYRYFNWKTPKFVHLPLLLNKDKSKLSKRQGDVAVEDYLKKGYVPEALLNFIALLGWNPGDNREIFSLKELEKEFSLKRVQKANAVFDMEKLDWMNGQYMKSAHLSEITELSKPWFMSAGIDISDKDKFIKVIEYARNRVSNLAELIEQSIMFYSDLKFTDNNRMTLDDPTSQSVFRLWKKRLSDNKAFSNAEIDGLLSDCSVKLGIKGKTLYFPLRLATFGNVHGPDIQTIYDILGHNEFTRRLNIQIND